MFIFQTNLKLGLYVCYLIGRSYYHRCSIIKSVFRDFKKFTGKHLCLKSLSTIEFVSVPRHYFYHNTYNPVVTIELHGFYDASMKTYGCCVYLRFDHRSKFVKVVLVTSKSRISPLSKQSIPKLELLSSISHEIFETSSSSRVYALRETFHFCFSRVF